MLRRLFSVLVVFAVLIASFIAWIYTNLIFDGCCGAPINYSNDSAQQLWHLAAVLLGLAIIILALRWGWRSRPTANK